MNSLMSISKSELDTFFNMGGVPMDENEIWPYTEFLYTLKSNNIELSFSIHPGFKDIRILLLAGESCLLDMALEDVVELKKQKEGEEEYLLVKMADNFSVRVEKSPAVKLEKLNDSLKM